jgi:hypothetical protein
MREELVDVVEFMRTRPSIGGMLGPNFDVNVRVSASGRGLVFEFEPAGGMGVVHPHGG